ncbi:hypothetical protein DYB32_003298 [Aphanomyces invadans]|uniref:WW domain-containing protein n=1 Tax=Aphanomyces invadans TaxID=157072 RepID=A0A3R7D2W0_9STRA|nr:hypothetical protein DYB32_003298 [Aphanomyces invadans]
MWVRHLDEDSTRFYYHNAKTGETSWTKPEGYTEKNEQDSNNTNDASDDDESHVDTKRQRTADDNAEENQDGDDGALWVKYIDPVSKKPYYSDMNSGRTRWEQPAFYTSDQGEDDDEVEEDQLEEEYAFGAVAAPASPKAPSPKAAPPPSTETPTFLRYVDAATKVPYYFNTATKETTWDVPPDGSIVQDGTTASTTTDSDTSTSAGSAKYQEWLNKASTVPTATRAAAAAASSRNAADPVSRLNSILGGSSAGSAFRWQQHYDPKTQRYYYFDTKTNTTQWEPPSDGSAVAAAVGGADWVPATTDADASVVSAQSDYTVAAHMNLLNGRFSGASGDQYFHKQNIPTDKAGRQLANFFDLTAFEANRAEAKRMKEALKTKNIDWKKYNEEKKRKRHRVRNKWMYED